MKLSEALACIHAPKGVTSIIAGAMTGDLDPLGNPSAVNYSLQDAEIKLADAVKAQQSCQSDWAFWGYEGDIAYWRSAVNILKAAEITGPDNLPDVKPLDLSGKVVMDACSGIEKFGEEMFRLAKGGE